MANVILRFEKKIHAVIAQKVPEYIAYIEFHLMPGNSLGRFWNIMKNGKPFQMKEKENFTDTAALTGYVKNMRAQYEDQGFKAVSGEWLKSSAKSSKDKAADKVKEDAAVPPPVISKSAGLGELPPGVEANPTGAEAGSGAGTASDLE